jgi:cardiolipin synthase
VFNPPSFRRGVRWFDRRDHRKIAVIDGENAFICGMNIGDEYTGFGENPHRWRDVGIGIRGPAVASLQRLFLENWSEAGGENAGRVETVAEPVACGDAAVMIVSGGPHHRRSFIHASFRLAIGGATSSVKILNPYFIPGVRVLRALLRAARRGVKVKLILPSISDVPLVKLLSRGYLSPLLRAGVEVYERQGTMLHAKLMFIDDHWAIIGSANLDARSLHRNYEVNITVDSHTFASQVVEMFESDLLYSRRVTLLEHEGRSRFVRLLEFILSPLGRFL